MLPREDFDRIGERNEDGKTGFDGIAQIIGEEVAKRTLYIPGYRECYVCQDGAKKVQQHLGYLASNSDPRD
jgi:hypothetical protein